VNGNGESKKPKACCQRRCKAAAVASGKRSSKRKTTTGAVVSVKNARSNEAGIAEDKIVAASLRNQCRGLIWDMDRLMLNVEY
jgi:hypothetical protein